MITLDEEYGEIRKRIALRTLASDIIYSLPNVGFWVKDMNFMFLDISEAASTILYGMNSNDCVGFTDFQIARKAGLEMSEEIFANVCRASDVYIINNPEKGKYQINTFVEIITDINGNKHIWKTLKGLHPDDVGCEKYIFGFAIFMDTSLGSLKKAEAWFEKEKHKYTKLNDQLYVQK